jgi:hypothetical protein
MSMPPSKRAHLGRATGSGVDAELEEEGGFCMPAYVTVDNEANDRFTVVSVEVPDYSGALPPGQAHLFCHVAAPEATARPAVTQSYASPPTGADRRPAARMHRRPPAAGADPNPVPKATHAPAGLVRVIAWALNGLDLIAQNATLETSDDGMATNRFWITTLKGVCACARVPVRVCGHDGCTARRLQQEGRRRAP